MGLRIATNIPAMTARRALTKNVHDIQQSQEQAATGSRINKAADDAAGLSISQHMTGHIRSMGQATRNGNDAISLLQVAEGGLNEISNIVIRLRELSIQAASDTIGDTERGFLNKEVEQLKNEINRIAKVSTWGTTKLLDGTTPEFTFQIGIFNEPENDRISFFGSQNNATLDALEIADINFSTKQGAQEGIDKLDLAQNHVSDMRSNIGSIQSRMQSVITNLDVHNENHQAARSRIRDSDVADVTSRMARDTVLLQAGVSTLAQANQNTNVALRLLS